MGKAGDDVQIDKDLQERLAHYVETARRGGSLGVYVWDETAHKTLYSFNPDSLMRPASNMKMLTCIAALRRLGPNYRFESGSYYTGEQRGDTLYGDVAFKFTFDPYFNSDSLACLADAVSRRGIHYVKGRVVLDLAVREPMRHEEHWTIGDLRLRHIGMLFRGEQRMVREVKYALSVRGVKYSDDAFVVDKLPTEANLLARTSTPMVRSVFRALQNSSNEHAECLGYPLALTYLHDQDYRESATRYVNRFVEKELGYTPEAVCRLHDTSGLCVHNRLSPRFLVSLLRYAHSHPYIFDTLKRCLPISGKTGTLHDRMWRPEIRGRVHAKTGTLTREDGITSLSGFVTAKNGHLLFFSIIQNEYPVYDARIWQDKFCAEFVK